MTPNKLSFSVGSQGASFPERSVTAEECSPLAPCPPLILHSVGATTLSLRHDAEVAVLADGTFYPSHPDMAGLLGVSVDSAVGSPDEAAVEPLPASGGETVNYHAVISLSAGRHRIHLVAGGYGAGALQLSRPTLGMLVIPR